MGGGHEWEGARWGDERRGLDGRMERGYAERLLVTCPRSLRAVAEGGREVGEGVVWRYLV